MVSQALNKRTQRKHLEGVWQNWFAELRKLTLNYRKINVTVQPPKGGRFGVMSSEPQADSPVVLHMMCGRGDFMRLTDSVA